mmetsp:Transcript_25493/g.82373  ORF Transcript_25493/g.82373 Transcript_25493/m.82373 type:complete len:298 (-) Transcript_25493:579-1472(-)
MMRVLVRSSVTREALELAVAPDLLLRDLKARATQGNLGGTAVKLIWAGTVLDDCASVGDLGIRDGDVLWMLSYDATSGGSAPPTPRNLESTFLSRHAPPSSAQDKFGGGRLRSFLQEHMPSWARQARLDVSEELIGERDRPTVWEMSTSEWTAFEWAIVALDTETPRFGRPPEVIWFGEYGCVLLAEMRHAAAIHLRLVCLDGWTFWEHSHPGGRVHTSQPSADATVQLLIGVIELNQCGPNELAGACAPLSVLAKLMEAQRAFALERYARVRRANRPHSLLFCRGPPALAQATLIL